MGRPTKYKPEYCQQLIDHQAKGLSFDSFAGIAKVNTDTLYEWVKKHGKFAEAKKEAYSLCLLFWERLGIGGAAGKIRGFNAASYIFNMKNRFHWRDAVELSGNSDKPIVIAYDPDK